MIDMVLANVNVCPKVTKSLWNIFGNKFLKIEEFHAWCISLELSDKIDVQCFSVSLSGLKHVRGLVQCQQ